MKQRTYDEILDIAAQFTSLTGWRKGYQAAYVYACKNKWQRQIADDLGWEPYRPVFRSYEECRKTASVYSSLNEWQKAHRRSYLCACRKNWQREIAKELGWKSQVSRKRTYKECLESARRFSSRKEWIEKDYTIYRYSHKREWDGKIVRALRWKTLVDRKKGREAPLVLIEDCLPFASNFSSLLDWQKGHRRSYSFAVRKGFQRDVAKKLGWKTKRWNGENV